MLGARKHIHGYLKEFLFDPNLADAKIGIAVGRRALAAAARARVRAAVEPAGARRADQRPRPRDARPAAGGDRRLRRHRPDRQPRPRLPRPHGDGDAGARRHRARSTSSPAATRIGSASARRARSREASRPQGRRGAAAAGRAARASSPTRTSATTTCCPQRIEEIDAAIARDEAAMADPDLYARDPARVRPPDRGDRQGARRRRTRPSCAGWNWRSRSRRYGVNAPGDFVQHGENTTARSC